MIIPVKIETGGYDIVLEAGALKNVGKLLNLKRRVFIVTDSGVPAQYAETVAAQCESPIIMTVEQGETSKCFEELRRLLEGMLNASMTRSDCVVAVGGGVVGDLSGFAASCYMRGIDFYNIPTTLLAQVDSSIGGKTAIDLNGVKNIVGAFYQPKCVVIDPEVLSTLSPRQTAAGLAEAIKMAATSDAELFSLIENSSCLTDDLPEIIRRALLIKRGIVEQDPREKGLRKVLNFGHTIGHAVESYNGGRLLHGECVALGMIPMSGGSARQRIKAVLDKYNLPTEISQSADELRPFLEHDKKAGADGISAVLTNEIGSFEICRMSVDEILARLM